MAQSNPPPTRSRTGWRGGKQQAVARHRWQSDPAAAGSRPILAREPWRTIRIGALFVLACGLMALLIYYLLYAPARTPLLAIVATDYTWPLPPNAWAKEDLAGLADLDKQTLGIRDLSENWRSPDRGLEQLTAELQAFAHRRQTQPIILWISMHGAVDGAGRPCLIPPGASPHDSETWLPLAAVFERIKAAGLPAGKPILVILDANRQLVNWHTGMLANTLADALPQAVEEAQLPGLVVLNSASPGEAAIASSQIRGSVFGHYLRLGMAGAADAWKYEGNGDGSVSVRELEQYLQKQVHGRVVHHRAAPQRPLLIPAEARNFTVVMPLRSSTWHSLVARAQRIERAAPAIPAEKLGALWKTHDRLREGRLWRLEPVSWRNIEQDLLWLEQLAEAGSAYEVQAKTIADQLQETLTAAQTRLAAVEASHSLPAHQAVLTPYRARWQVEAHSLPLSQFLGMLDPAAARTLSSHWLTCQQAPSDSTLQSAVAAFEQANLPGGTTEGNLLGLWRRYFVPSIWPDAQVLSEVLASRSAAERLATPFSINDLPGDERAHAWLRPQAAALDRLCRKLEDGAILGPQASDLQTARIDAAAAAQSAEEFGRRTAEVFAARDQLWAELPYLAQWLSRPQFDAAAQDRADLAVRQELLPLIADGLALEEQLTRDEPGGDATDEASWSADATAEKTRGQFEQLQQRLRTATKTLQSAGPTAQAVADIDAALATPLVPWDTRQQLRQKRLDLLADLAGKYREAGERATPAEKTQGEAAGAIDHAERIATRWPQHPLAAILERVPAAAASSDKLPALGERIRHQLLALSHDDLTATPGESPEAKPATQPAAEATAAVDLADLCRAESLVRTAAAVWFDPPGIDPVEALRQADLQQLLLWQARRAMDDFYGPAGPGQEPLFAIAAGDYLAAAKTIAPLSPAGEAQAQAVTELLSRRRIAAIESLTTSASDILLVDQATTVSSTVLVRTKLAESLADLPDAQGAVFLTDDQGRIGPTAWPLPHEAVDGVVLRQDLLLDATGLRERGPLIRTIATLRGNEFPTPLLLRAPGGARVAYRRPTYGPPRVTVHGFDKKRASVVFILDCSHSMKEATRTERPDATDQPRTTRMDVAKGALRAMLEQLAERGNARVGVRLFGHRVGWSTVEENKLLRQTGYSDEIPTTLRPYADVEAVLPLGRFDSVVAGGVYEKLAGVQPWGETPLYLAITQALADFTTEDDAERSIVVITDGRNNQFNPPTEFQRSKDDVLTAARRAQVPITIVGFEIPAAEAATARAEFEEIASGSGGLFLPATGATAFVQALESLLKPGEFRVTDAVGTTIDRAELGASVSLGKIDSRQDFSVTFESLREPIEVVGGEAVELVVRRDRQRLAVPAFLRGNPRFERLVAEDGAATPLQAGVHRAVRSQEAVTFQVSVQHTDNRFVPRPAEMWIEVTPQGTLDEVDAAPFIFYDIPAEPGTPCPVLNLPAYGWPAGAPRGQVRIWSKPTPTIPTHAVLLSEVADRVPTEGAGYGVPGIAGVSYQVRTAGGAGQPLVVGIVERHDPRSRGIDAMRVEITPQADHVIHQFDPKNRVVLHAFTYDQPDADLKTRQEIRFTSRESAHAGSYHLAQPVLVDVSDRADLLDITPIKKER